MRVSGGAAGGWQIESSSPVKQSCGISGRAHTTSDYGPFRNGPRYPNQHSRASRGRTQELARLASYGERIVLESEPVALEAEPIVLESEAAEPLMAASARR